MESDLVVIEALAVGPDAALCAIGSHAAAAVAYCGEIPVWLVAGRGRRLPEPLWKAMLERLDGAASSAGDDAWELEVEAVPLAMVTAVVDDTGLRDPDAAAFAPECPVAHELLRTSAM
jgi:hypothetical protein